MHNLRNFHRLAGALLIVAALGLLAGPVWAQNDPPRGITVTGRGEASAKPDMVEIVGVVSGQAEMAGDAIVKFRDTKRRATEALQDLAIEGLSVEPTGFTLSSGAGGMEQMQQMMMGGQQNAPTPQVAVTEPMTIRIAGVDQMEPDALVDTVTRVIDAGKDAGLTIGSTDAMSLMEMQFRGGESTPLARFKIAETEALRQQAYEQAMAQARSNAERLATLAGVELGPVVSVTEAPIAGQESSPMMAMFAFAGVDEEDVEDRQYVSNAFGDIPVRVNLVVQFAIGQ